MPTDDIRIGSDTPDKIYLGSDEIEKVYIGSDLFWDQTGGGGGVDTWVQKMVGAWTGNDQFAASTSNTFTKEVIALDGGAERWNPGAIRFWNGDDALNYGATASGTRSVFATAGDCGHWWKGTDPTNFGNGFKVRVSFDNEATWIWLNTPNSDSVIEGATQTRYINTGGSATNVINAITTVSGGAQSDFYSGLPMVVEVYDV